MITVEFGFYGVGYKRVNIFTLEDCHATFIRLGFMSIGLWNRKASLELIRCIRELRHDDEWVLNNWPRVRQAERKGYAKGRAQGIAISSGWKESYLRTYEELTKTQIENNHLRYAIQALREIDAARQAPTGA